MIIRTETDRCFIRAGADLWHDPHITVLDTAATKIDTWSPWFDRR